MAQFTGHCACKASTYVSTHAPRGSGNCHCGTCQALSPPPHHFITFSLLDLASVSFTPALSQLRAAPSDLATRYFCRACDGHIAMSSATRPDGIWLVTRTMDEGSWKDGVVPDTVKPSMHIFLKEKADGFKLEDDGLERYEEFPPRTDWRR